MINYIKERAGQMKEAIYDIDCVFDGFDGKGAIYVSSYQSACLKSVREGLNIRAVVSIASGAYLDYHDELVEYLYIPAKDTDAYQISSHFSQTNSFLDKHRRNGNVLVHCMVGKSRSATIVAAYLLAKFRYSLPTVMNLLQRKRKKIDPNPGFMKQLEQYCDQIGVEKGQSSERCRSINKSVKHQRSTICPSSVDKGLSKQQQLAAQREEEKEKAGIASKIEMIREKYITGKTKNKYRKLYCEMKILQSSGSASLPSHTAMIGSSQAKSVELS